MYIVRYKHDQLGLCFERDDAGVFHGVTSWCATLSELEKFPTQEAARVAMIKYGNEKDYEVKPVPGKPKNLKKLPDKIKL